MDPLLLKRKTALAFAWSAAKSGIDQLSSFAVFLVLGRMLTPDDFGLVALAAAVVEVLRLVSWAGLYEAIIQARNFDDLAADTAFWTSAAIGTVLTGAVVLCAAPVAALFGQPALERLVPAMAPIILASSLGITHTGRLARDFGHKALAMRALAANLAGGAVALAVALAGFGLWALVAQRLAAEAVQSAAVWVALKWRPRLRFSPAELRNILAFGAGMTVANIVAGVNTRVQEGVVGLTLPASAVGALRIAGRLTELIQQMVFMPAHQAALVGFSRLQGDPQSFRDGTVQSLRLAGLVAFPCFFGLAAVAPGLVPWLFGPQWRASVPILQALCLAVAPQTVQAFVGPALIASGRTGGLAVLSLVSLATGIAITAAAAPHGIVAVAAGLSLRAWLLLPATLWLLWRGAGVRWTRVAAALIPPFAASLLTAVPVWAMGELLRPSLPVPAVLAVQMAGYALVYLGFAYATSRRVLLEAVAALRP